MVQEVAQEGLAEEEVEEGVLEAEEVLEASENDTVLTAHGLQRRRKSKNLSYFMQHIASFLESLTPQY